ncbi:MAG: phosphodiester glycosidase family protein [Gulosibacter sp.]|uniref:phosphodiester glycosidase family protein n=1 Tax=Gulosibacter sp. TaxID=2817531 RepID=UPI003F8E01E7
MRQLLKERTGKGGRSRGRAFVAGLVTFGLGGTLVIPTVFSEAEPAHAATALESAVDAMVLDAGGNAIVSEYNREQIAPGVEMVSVDRIDAQGRLEFDVLVADFGSGEVRADYLYPDTVSEAQPVTDMITNSGAVAGVNGSFFDINNSSAPQGVGVSETDGIVTIPDGMAAGNSHYQNNPIVFGENGLGAIAQVLLDTTVTHNGEDVDIDVTGVNSWRLNAGSVGYYNELWGDHTRVRVLDGGSGIEVIFDAEGVVTSIGAPSATPLAEGEQSLIGRDAGADKLAGIEVGDTVSVEYGVTSNAGEVVTAIGGNNRLVIDGAVNVSSDQAVHPRTGVGFNADGSIMYLVAVDGRQATSRGLALNDFAQLFIDLGAQDAVNLDGGGSTTMGAVAPGETAPSVPHNPSDGYLRSVPNGIGLFVEQGSGQVTAYNVQTTLDMAESARVFPGLSRTVIGKGHDETGSAVAGTTPAWTSTDAATVTSNGDNTAVVTGGSQGTATVTATTGEATGSIDLQVLGELERIEVSPSVVQLSGTEDIGSFNVYGYDSNGYRTPIEAQDITITGNEEGHFDIEAGTTGTYAVSANQTGVSTSLELAVGDKAVSFALTAGVESLLLADFADGTDWTSANDRAPSGSVTAITGHEGTPGLQLDYNFEESTGTRGQYAVAPNGGFELPGQPTAITMWVNGDGNGSWPRLQVRQSNGTTTQIDGPLIEWNGWQQATFAIPVGVEYPLTLQRIRLMETAAAKQYSGSVQVSDMRAAVPNEVDLPETDTFQDSVVVPAGTTDESPLRIAVVSDSQFVARNPDSQQVQGARESFQEVKAANPDLLVINGDFVDEAAPEDFGLAQKIIDDELGDAEFPYIYVTGNHEIMGGPIENFEAAFGETHGTMDLDGTRIIWLDTAPGTLSHDYDQVKLLREELDKAAADDAISGVVVFQHMPIDDPLPTKASQLGDRLDADMEEQWLEEFKQDSGKPIALVSAHVGVFHAKTTNGIPYFINGNSGKSPTGGAEGSFTGWTMLGVHPAEAESANPRDWFKAEVQTRVDADTLTMGDVPELVNTGVETQLTPAFTQDQGARSLLPQWPMSHSWSGEGIHVGSIGDAPDDAIANLDPETNILTALSSGEATLTLTVNNESESMTFTVDGISGSVPVISGTPQVGEVLTVDAGQWQPEGVALSCQWFADGEPVETTETLVTALAAAEGETFVLLPEHEGAEISVAVTGSLEGYAPLTVTSEPTTAVAAAPVATPEPTPTGEPTPEPTSTGEPTPDPTSTGEPTTEPTTTEVPTTEPTSTEQPTSTEEPTPEPTATDAPTTEPTVTEDPTTDPTASTDPTSTENPTTDPTASADSTATEGTSGTPIPGTEGAGPTDGSDDDSTEDDGLAQTGAETVGLFGAVLVIALLGTALVLRSRKATRA